MVSLVNFKTFDEDLSERRPPPVECDQRQLEFNAGPHQDSGGRLKAASDFSKQQTRRQTSAALRQSDSKASSKLSPTNSNCQDPNRNVELSCDFHCYKPTDQSSDQRSVMTAPGPGSDYVQCYPSSSPSPHAAGAARTGSFTVTWRKLKFCIEPKWHEKIAASSSALVALAGRVTSSSSISSASSSCSSSSQCSTSEPSTATECAQQQRQQQQQQQRPTTTARVVLDQLDGSFRSSELTAILGPSGAGKTTLLDCLTGHRKSGLSGSIRFSSSASLSSTAETTTAAAATAAVAPLDDRNLKETCGLPDANCPPDCCLAPGSRASAEPKGKQRNLILASHRRHHQTGCLKQASKQMATAQLDGTCCCRRHELGNELSTPTTTLMQGDNLKVSIIPQNDHLIGHLTVHETLNYASKLKNCAKNGEFDHKLNIKRVAQQLGLMSCLGTRINKLSGGQYKRVSIAQELLSSPDVLILDEPTSGLDAMTCFQTVQVLKKLTDDRRASGQKSIAVILTIHQPNSDVFQQFNHVYVVAQGGKCIYEGPPGNIESVINRVGICLPNSYYNPATMIVEIAAGKFGQAAISKLNAIQRKQYGEQSSQADEQNSTGDSAVDCPSSNYEDDDDADDNQDGDQDRQNNEIKSSGGKVNAGFIMDSELDSKDANNNGSVELEAADSCCVPLHCHEATGAETDVVELGCDKQPLESAGSSAIVDTGEKLDRRKRRRRMRRRASDRPPGETARTPSRQSKLTSPFSLVRIPMVGNGAGDGDSGSDAGGSGCQQRGEKRLKLNSLKADQKFPFWRHTYLHFHRSWLSIVRDPLLCSMQLALHIMVPVMVSLVYGTYVGKPNACPRAGPIDIMAYAMESTDTALQLQEDLRTTLENIGYIFFKLYGIIFAAMTVTVLTFPLDMHVLVKEFRNGWYGLSSYFLGRTLADIPFQLTLPLLAMALSYYATGQPSSYLQWRFFSITAILILSSLIAQSQGLLFGAILMDKMKAAVFVAPAATTPIILFAGFLVRTQSIPSYLRPLSNLSYLRYAIEACLISRYGFNQCECDPAIFNQTVPELPPIARSMLDYWLSSYKPSQQDSMGNGSTLLADSAEALDATANKPDLFTKLTDSLARANSFGRNITSCDQVVPYPMIDYDLKDEHLYTCFAILLAMLIFTRLLTFFIVCFKVKRKV